jgi:putative transposase
VDFDAVLAAFDGADDHLHLRMNDPPKVWGPVLVNSLKGVSSRMIRRRNDPSMRRKLWGGALGSPSSFAGSCCGAPIAVIRQSHKSSSRNRSESQSTPAAFGLSSPA